MLIYYGIKTPEERYYPSVTSWIASCKDDCWRQFFENYKCRVRLDEAIRAYEAIGYKCVKLEVKEVKEIEENREIEENKENDEKHYIQD
jgi:hypothetical protein